MAPIDFAVIALYLGAAIFFALAHRRRAGRSSEEFFAAGRSLPWWLAGTSIVATTFAADTPLAIAGLVATEGVAGNWFWWADVLPAMLAAFVVAHLWRRSGVRTDNEITELRYAGRRAAGLRLFRALYFGVLRNAIVIGWVNLAMLKVLELSLDLDPAHAPWVLCGLFVFTVVYTLLAGLLGVVLTDVLQFTLAMGGSIALAILALDSVGGLGALVEALGRPAGPAGLDRLALIPVERDAFLAFVIYVAVKSWSSGNTEGSGYVAQRLLATRDERHARLAAIWFAVANFALRPWPWIIVGLVAVVTHGDLEDPEAGYVRVMLDVLPAGALGLMIATLLAAYMSTIDTHLNWGASYLTHDVYQRFLHPDAHEQRLVAVARLAIVALAALGTATTLLMPSISGAWKFLASISAGTGAVLLLRWLWWRVNAWSEIVVMSVSLVATNVLLLWTDVPFPLSLAIVVAVSLPAALLATFLTAPEPPELLRAFHARIRPPGAWAAGTGERGGGRALGRAALGAVFATLGVYGMLLGVGSVLLDGVGRGVLASLAGVVAFGFATAQFTISSSSTSKDSVAPGRISGGDPRSP